jgi:hypothetical protein
MRRGRQYHFAINANTAKIANKINVARPYEKYIAFSRLVKPRSDAASRKMVIDWSIELSKVLCATTHTGIAYWQ